MNCQNSNNGCRWSRRRHLYTGSALCFLAFVLSLAVGLILGAVNYETILPVIAAFIAFAAAIAAIIIALIIYWFICKNN